MKIETFRKNELDDPSLEEIRADIETLRYEAQNRHEGFWAEIAERYEAVVIRYLGLSKIDHT